MGMALKISRSNDWEFFIYLYFLMCNKLFLSFFHADMYLGGMLSLSYLSVRWH